MFYVWPTGRYLRVFDILLYGVCIRLIQILTLRNQLITTIHNIIHVGLFTIWLYLMCASVGLTFWITSKSHSYANLEVSYMIRKVPTSFWLLVDVQYFLRYLYTCRVQPSLYGNISSAYRNWLSLSSACHPGKLYHVNLYYTNILKLRTREWLYSVL